MNRPAPASLQSSMHVLLRDASQPVRRAAIFDAKAIERDVQIRRNLLLYGLGALGFILALSAM